MPTYVYSDGQHEFEIAHSMHTTDVPCECGLCGRELHRVPRGGVASFIVGAKLKETPLRREFIAQNRDGSESVYRTREQAYRAELERTENPKIAAANVRHLGNLGYLPGTKQAQFAAALDSAPGGRVGSAAVT